MEIAPIGVNWGHPERFAEGVDPVDRDAEEAGTQAGIDRGQEHQQRREPGVDVPVGGRPPSI